ncbi:MAG TPA: aminotransferase class III-fold pyridoxal phosphate-dependent enzyme [Solirubrobacteraceae bacterium]|jgi:glutamate-1-semialdehyde 2,1-aminomutase
MSVQDTATPDMPNARELVARAREHIPGGSSRSTLLTPPHSPYALRGEGCKLIDVDGHELIDLHGNYSALVHGHAFPPVVRAAGAALSEGSCFGLPSAAEVELAEQLATRIPWAAKWRFAGSGTEAVMAAVRGARAASDRELIVRFAGCYHGSADELLQPGAPGVPRSAQSDVLTLPLGEERPFRAALAEHGERVAAVLLDLMPNRPGLRPVTSGFAALVRAETAARGIALILDEVITFRLAPAGLQALYGIEGDMVTLGKTIGGGLPVGALGGRSRWMDVFDSARADAVPLAGTFTANPVSMRAGLAALEALDAEAIERIDALGERLRAGLAAQHHETSGRGSLLKLHAPDRARLWWRLYREGVLIAADGLMCVSTAMDEQTIDDVLGAFARARER